MKKCTFHYRPTIINLYTCDTIEEIDNGTIEFYAESFINGCGTNEYEITEDDVVIFSHIIDINNEEEEDLELSDIEGKILIRQVEVYSKQSIPCELEDGTNEPNFIYHGLANSFDEVYFEDDVEELQDYEPMDGETTEQYFEYYKIKNGIAEPLEL